jgi:3',5'-nucleoside bisphosphate phosphatase
VLVDFHCHTNASDGTLPAAALLAAMRTRGVGICSITDHDSLAAHDERPPANGVATSPRVISGVEINTTYRANEVHVLGYGFGLEPGGALRALLEANRIARRGRVELMVAQLRGAGYDLTLDEVLREAAPGATLGRPHVAMALARKKLVRDVAAAFRTLLSRERPGYVPSSHIRPDAAIAAIASAGGVAVLAHPGRLQDEALIEELVEMGIAGLEVFYRAHAPGQVAHFRSLAKRYGLVMTAGSDFHDARWNTEGVGMEVEEDDVRPFLDLVA